MLVRGGDGGKSVAAVTGRGDNNKRVVMGVTWWRQELQYICGRTGGARG